MATSEIQSNFTETLNVRKCIQVLNLSKVDIKENFWQKTVYKNDTTAIEWSSYVHILKKLMRASINANGRVKQEYKFAAGHCGGRLYVKGGGIQSLQHQVRNFVSGEYYYDVDMVNCHPRILLHVCKTHNIQTVCLSEYVDDRETVLRENGLSKQDILIAMYTDNNKVKRTNEWFNCFIYELKNIKKTLLPILKEAGVITNNIKNPDSSILSRHLNSIESTIIQIAIQYFGTHAEVPMFDGVMVRKDFCDEHELDGHMACLNDRLQEEFHGCIIFKAKSTDCDIQLPEVDNDAKEYPLAKIEFEKHHFLTVNPFVFWKQNRVTDGSFEYNQLRPDEFKLVCKEYKIIDYKANGDLVIDDIFNKWMGDRTKKQYDKIDFVPYGKSHNCPPYIYNTFDGFHAPTLQGYTNPVDVSNFKTLIWNLCDENQEMNDYVTNYIAHMFQCPDKLPEEIIVFKSWTGTGKDTLVRTLQRLMGNKYVAITEEPDHIFGQFNDTLKSKICVFLNEMEGKHGVNYQEKLKGHSTSQFNRVNAKYEKPIIESNHCRLFINSNNDNPVNVQMNDRRFVICQSGYGLVANTADPLHAGKVREFWNKYYEQLRSDDWVASLYEYLFNEIDLSTWDSRKVPGGVAKELMRSKNINPVYFYLQQLQKNPNKVDLGWNRSKESVYFIKFKRFFAGYKYFLDINYPDIEYKIKEQPVRAKLNSMTKGCYAEKQLSYTDSDGIYKSRDKNAVFDFERIGLFLDNFIFTDNDDMSSEELGTVDTSRSSLAPGFVVEAFSRGVGCLLD
jgi:hypothetical protein